MWSGVEAERRRCFVCASEQPLQVSLPPIRELFLTGRLRDPLCFRHANLKALVEGGERRFELVELRAVPEIH